MRLEILPLLKDNYAFFILNESTGEAAVVDPALADPVMEWVRNANVQLKWILNTHHHWDHTDGNLEIQAQTGCAIIGHALDRERIPGLTHPVQEGTRVSVCGVTVEVLATSGHTSGHLCYWIESEKILFTGDTLFLSGCGRLFEGSPEQMWKSLLKIRQLPADTRIYCGHEYTQKNLEFACALEEGNRDLENRLKAVRQLRQKGQTSLPGLLGEELKWNPFLRADDPLLQQTLGLLGQSPAQVFTEIRKRKDQY